MVLDMDSGHIVDRTTKEIKAQTMEINDLFEMKMATPGSKAADPTTSGHASGSATAETWHRRMGHLGYDNLKRLVKAADGIHLTDIDLSNPSSYKPPECEPCRRAFAKRKPFGQAPRATREDEVIHVNLVYPIKPTGYDRSKGYVSITDN